MKNTLISLLAFLLLSFGLQAQASMADKGQQLVYFEDGSVVKGIIVSYHINKTLVMLVGGEEVEFSAQQVAYIARGKQGKKMEEKVGVEKMTYEYAFKERGIYNVSSLSLNVGNDFEGTTVGVGVQHVLGYQFNRWIGAGAGVGIDVFGFNAEKPFVAVFGDVRGYFLPKKVSPFYAFQMGYGFLNDQRIRDAKGGLLVYPALGVRFSGKAGANFSMDIGYKYQKSEVEYGWWDSYQIWNYRYHRYVFRVGLTF
jgi:hypothetical protein